MSKDYAIFSLRVANILANKGFKIINSRVNYKDPKYMVYYFEDTPALRNALEKLSGVFLQKKKYFVWTGEKSQGVKCSRL